MACISFVATVFLLVGSGYAADIAEDEGVLVLTDSNFDEAISSHSNILVEFCTVNLYCLVRHSCVKQFFLVDAPWCGHCKALAPEYAKAAQTLKEENSEIRLAKVDATLHTKVSEKFEVRGYPTIKFFRSGKPAEYTGGRTAPEIVTWLNKKTGPPTKDLSSPEVAQAFIDSADVTVVGFFADTESAEAKAFTEAAAGYDELEFGQASDAAVLAAYAVASPAVVMFRKFDEPRVDYDGDLTSSEDILAFIKRNSLPLVNEFSDQTAPRIFGGDIKSHILLFAKKSDNAYKSHVAAFTEAAKEYRGQVLFVTVDIDVEDNSRIMEFFGMKENDVPAVRLIFLGDEMKKYKPPSTDLTADAMKEFVKGYLDGSLKVVFI
jgi:protein disulfide-isomerase A1